MLRATAVLLGFALTVLAGPAVIAVLKRRGCAQHVRDDVPAGHQKKEGTPTCGGLLIVGAAVLAFALTVMLGGEVDMPAGAVVIFMLLAAAVGFADDWLSLRRGKNLGLKARHKLALQIIIVAAFLYHRAFWQATAPILVVPFTGQVLRLGWGYYVGVGLFMLAALNAVNLTDGLDGLASGLAAISSLALAALGVRFAEPATSVFCLTVAGACLGFLWFNAHPASVFMGDTGSLALGAALAGSAVVMHQELLFILIGLPFFVEALSVVIQVASFKLTRRRVFRMSPLHHHFELAGWPENQVVVRFWLAGALIALLSVGAESFRGI